ncbi:hypothetical protein SISSUDRAFT_1067271 [Sistotremastrum suecicum HHB10207 ss-3]|uniref:C2 domain-containing protein n=1 Tax=Sistotremastrum suecicum HHB10207 ss-3 TaxID=1314776 RepID=A0A165XAY1_9AGAM|nr:hypothetical protein SISSUDRAFT_1067271 [Sistotremastrum suecicum HHB10207 ss-3]
MTMTNIERAGCRLDLVSTYDSACSYWFPIFFSPAHSIFQIRYSRHESRCAVVASAPKLRVTQITWSVLFFSVFAGDFNDWGPEGSISPWEFTVKFFDVITATSVEDSPLLRDNKAQTPIQISEIRGYNFPKAHGMLKAANQFSLALECGTQKKVSEVSKRDGQPLWDEGFEFDSTSTSVAIKVYIHHSLGKDELVGEMGEDVSKLLASAGTDGSIRRVLKIPGRSSAVKNPPEISFKMTVKTTNDSMRQAIEAGKAKWKEVQKSPVLLDQTSKELVTAAKIQSTITAATENVMPFLDKLDKFVKLVDTISEVHPYAKIAWSVISAGYNFRKK